MTVVTDTSVVLNLAWLQREELLAYLYETIMAPLAVRDEFERLARSDARFRGLVFPSFITLVDPIALEPALIRNVKLDDGEIAALSLALERGVKDVLIDERAGRAAAAALGLRPSGLLGILVQSKERGRIPNVIPLLDRLQAGARFRVSSDLRERLLVLTGESPSAI